MLYKYLLADIDNNEEELALVERQKQITLYEIHRSDYLTMPCIK